jgi:hypothetical protein
MAREVVMRPTRTSWGAILDGWLATVGVAAILTPIVGLVLTNGYPTGGYASTVPILVAVGVSYLIGGYVSGRIAGYRTSWHGMMVAFFGLFVVLALLVVDTALALGVFGTPARLVPILPVVLGIALFESAETFAFGGALSILIAIFAGWLGGVMAPSHVTAAMTAAGPVMPTPVGARKGSASEVRKPRERYRLLPSIGQKGGQRVDTVATVAPVERTEPIETS